MNLLNTLIFSLLSVIMLVLLYSVMTRRMDRIVSFIGLWRTVREARQDRSFLKKFITDRRFFIHLIILLLLLFALMQFSLETLPGSITGQKLILIMDISASMKAREGEISRLDLAKKKALSLIGRLRNPEVMIITAGYHTRTVLPFSRDRSKIKYALRDLQAEETVADIEAAVLQTKSYATEGTSVYLLSDGAFEDAHEIIDSPPHLSFFRIGQTTDNASLTNLEMPGHTEDIYRTANVLVKNYRPVTFTSEVELFADTEVIDLKRVEIPALGEKSLFFHDVPGSVHNLKATLNTPDAFMVDNSRYLTRQVHQSATVVLVSRGSYYMKLLLEQFEDLVVTVLNPSGYEELMKSAGNELYDIGIYDNYSPSAEMSRTSIYINPDQDMHGIVFSNKTVVPNQLHAYMNHPVMRHAAFSDVLIQKANAIQSFEGAVLMESPETPLILITEKNGIKRIIFGFDIRNSNFPKSINFPVFFTNLFHWLRSPTMDINDYNIISGERFFRLLPQKSRHHKSATIKTPNGTEMTIPIENGFIDFSDTYQTGIYKIILGSEEIEFAVNLDASEYDITPTGKVSDEPDRNWSAYLPALSLSGLWKICGIFAVVLLIWEKRAAKNTIS